jgi:hypothetical protein
MFDTAKDVLHTPQELAQHLKTLLHVLQKCFPQDIKTLLVLTNIFSDMYIGAINKSVAQRGWEVTLKITRKNFLR